MARKQTGQGRHRGKVSPGQREKSRSKGSVPRRRPEKSWTLRRFNALTPAEKEDYFRAKQVIREVRDGKSLSRAARDLKTTVEHVRELFPGDFFKAKGSRRWSVSKSDNHVNQIPVIGEKGKEIDLVRGSRNASLWGHYWNDVTKAVRDNDPSILDKWRDKKIAGRPVITDFGKLIEMANAGVLGVDDSWMWRS